MKGFALRGSCQRIFFAFSGAVLVAFGQVDARGQVANPPAFFTGKVSLTKGVYYLKFSSGNPFGYYVFLDDARDLYHFYLGYKYVFDAQDGRSGVYLYDFASRSFFYTSPSFPVPYLCDFSLNAVLYYYPGPNNPDRYNTNGVRYFHSFATGENIFK